MDNFAIFFCWGVAAMIAGVSTAGSSGAHINPVVTISQALFDNFSWKKVQHYLLAQYCGCFAASCVVFATFYDALDAFDGGIRIAFGEDNATGGIFATYPNSFMSLSGVFLDQIVAASVLMYCISAVTDDKRQHIPRWMQPIFMCFVITALATAFGFNCMATLNPARDVSSRLFTALAGWGWETFSPLDGHFWWVAGIAGPHVGAVLGGFLYRLTIDHTNLRKNSIFHFSPADLKHLNKFPEPCVKEVV